MRIPILSPSPLSSLLTAPIIIIAHYSYSYIISPPPRPRLEAPAIAQSSLGGLLQSRVSRTPGEREDKPEGSQRPYSLESPSSAHQLSVSGWEEVGEKGQGPGPPWAELGRRGAGTAAEREQVEGWF